MPRRFQFSLRALMVAILFIGAAAVPLGYWVRRPAEEGPVPGGAILKMYSYASGNQYVLTLTYDEISARPKSKKEDENPPLSARKAIESATRVKDSLVRDDEHYRWHLLSAELHPWINDYWYWVVTFEAHFRGASSGTPITLRLIVLMDGRSVKPEVNPWPPPEDANDGADERSSK